MVERGLRAGGRGRRRQPLPRLRGRASPWWPPATRHPEVVAAIKAQADRFLHMCATDFYYDSVVALAEGLARRAPGPGPWRVFFANSGAEVVEAAIKLARLRTGRQKIVAFYGAFHGRTYGAMSLTASKPVQRRGYGPFAARGASTPTTPTATAARSTAQPETCDVECLDLLTETMFGTTVDPREVAAVIVEPVQGEGGYVVPASRLPEAAARGHARARHPAHRRRGAVRDGPYGPPLRERALRPRARHRDPGQGHRLGHAPRRAPRPRRGDAVERRGPRLDLRRQPGLGGRGPGHPATCSRGAWSPNAAAGGGPPDGGPARAARPPCRGGRRARARADDRSRDREGPREPRAGARAARAHPRGGLPPRPAAPGLRQEHDPAWPRPSSSTARTPRSRPSSWTSRSAWSPAARR